MTNCRKYGGKMGSFIILMHQEPLHSVDIS